MSCAEAAAGILTPLALGETSNEDPCPRVSLFNDPGAEPSIDEVEDEAFERVRRCDGRYGDEE